MKAKDYFDLIQNPKASARKKREFIVHTLGAVGCLSLLPLKWKQPEEGYPSTLNTSRGPIRITALYLNQSNRILIDGYDERSDRLRQGIYVPKTDYDAILTFIGSVIHVFCGHCGSCHTFCDARVNPNTGEIASFPDDAFDGGWCNLCCEHVILCDPVRAQTEIGALYLKYKTEHDSEPGRIWGRIMLGTHDEKNVTIDFSPAAITPQNDSVFCYCMGLEQLKALTIPSERGFTLLEVYRMLPAGNTKTI